MNVEIRNEAVQFISGNIWSEFGKMRQLQKRKQCQQAGVDQVSGKSI